MYMRGTIMSEHAITRRSFLAGSAGVAAAIAGSEFLSFGKYDSSNKQHIKLRSKLKRRSEDVQIDASGRIMLPAKMRGAVDIDKDVVIVGNTGYFEVWDAKRCDEADEDVDLDLLFH